MPTSRPVYLKRLASPGAEAFATLFALESLSRALLATVIPLQALAYLGDAQGVSSIFFAASGLSLAASLSVPWMIRRTSRRLIYSLAFLGLATAPTLLLGDSVGLFFAGMVCRAVAIAALTICLSLYILDFIARKDFGRSEPMRLFYSAGAWSLGPFLGILVAETFGLWVTYGLSAACALSGLGYFWFLRIKESPAVKQPAGPTPTPLRHVRRYFAQPRLTLAWLLATGRNIWWVIFFIYAPIYAVEAGLGEIAGGAIVSCGTGFLFLMPLLGRQVRSHGVRAIMRLGFGMGGVLTCGLLVAWDAPWLGAALLVSAAFGMILVDACGNLPFMVAVRRNERAEMTAVYSTFRDTADVVPPGLFALLLRFFEFQVVFAVGGLLVLGLAALSGKVHPRLGRDRGSESYRPIVTGAPPVMVAMAAVEPAAGREEA